MIKLFIHKTEKSRIQKIFEFISKTQSRVYIDSEGLNYQNNNGSGSIHKDFFIKYDVQGKKRLVIFDEPKQMKSWIRGWKEKENSLIELVF